MNTKYRPLLILICLLLIRCQPLEQQSRVDLDPVRNLILLDRDAVVPYEQDIKRILTQRDSVYMPELNAYAYSFAWGGETGGPWKRVICFFRPSPERFQCEFYYDGEYKMSGMNASGKPLNNGKDHSLGKQLTQIGHILGDEVKLNKEKMKTLLVLVMEQLIVCQRIRRSYMDSLDVNMLLPDGNSHLDFLHRKSPKFIETLKKVKNEMTLNPDPNVFFFYGELINGIWKATIRQFDHTGRFCIELEYLNGEFAYTFWL